MKIRLIFDPGTHLINLFILIYLGVIEDAVGWGPRDSMDD